MLRSRCSPLRLVYPLDLLCQREPIASDLLIRASYVRIVGLRGDRRRALFVGNRQLVLTCENFLPAELPPELPPNGSL
jgi:hypothetical protein